MIYDGTKEMITRLTALTSNAIRYILCICLLDKMYFEYTFGNSDKKPNFLNFFLYIYKIQHFIRILDILHYYQINCCISGPLLKKMHQSLQWSFQFFIWVRKNGSKRETRRGSFKENHTTFLQNVFHYRIY